MAEQITVEVEVTQKSFRTLFKVVETDKRYVIVESSNGVRHKLYRDDHLTIYWNEKSGAENE